MTAMFLRSLSDLFVKTLCVVPDRGKHTYPFNANAAMPCRSSGEIEQGTDPFRGCGVAAKQTRRTIFACRHIGDRKAGVVAWFMASLIFGSPQSNTNSERIAKGIQAFKTCPAE